MYERLDQHQLQQRPSKPERGITTIAKTSTRQEADAIFLKHEPDWQGEIPYFENVEKRYRKKPNL